MSAMRNSYWTKPIWAFMIEMLALATVFSQIFGCKDCASGNQRYTADWCHEPQTNADFFDCFSHQGQIALVTQMLAVFGARYLFRLNSVAVFANLGAVRLRLMMVVKSTIRSKLDFKVGEVLECDDLYRKEIKSFFMQMGRGSITLLKTIQQGKDARCSVDQCSK
jgi:hypothetical protein